jgi:quercetin dioxygenase-like cupin family protein
LSFKRRSAKQSGAFILKKSSVYFQQILAMPSIELSSIKPVEIIPGYSARFIHTAGITLSYLDVKAGAALQEHSHMHEQVSTVIEGTFQLTVDGEVIVVKPGAVVVIPSNIKHSGLAITDCKLLDVFTPVREDYRALSEKK